MPVVYVAERDPKKRARKLMRMIVPVLKDSDAQEYERWEWPELRVGTSLIPGCEMFGLFPQSTDALSWASLDRMVIVPYLGKETEVESSQLARVLRGVLCGNFDSVTRAEMHTPSGHEWVVDGCYVVLMKAAEAKRAGLTVVTEPQTQLIQVAAQPEFEGVSHLAEGDEEVCYMLREETRALLHLPHHVFDLLARHCDDEHNDRNMCTHVVQFQRHADVRRRSGPPPPLSLDRSRSTHSSPQPNPALTRSLRPMLTTGNRRTCSSRPTRSSATRPRSWATTGWSKWPSWRGRSWPSRAPQTAFEGWRLPSALRRRGPASQIPPRGRGPPATRGPSRHFRCV